MQLRIQGVSCETIPRVLLGMSFNQLLNICRNFSINSEGNQWMYLVTELKDGVSMSYWHRSYRKNRTTNKLRERKSAVRSLAITVIERKT